MTFTFLDLFDLIGTIGFALSGSAVAVKKKMDIMVIILRFMADHYCWNLPKVK